MTDFPGSYDSAAASHRALRVIQQEIERHAIVTDVWGLRAGEFSRLQAYLMPRQ